MLGKEYFINKIKEIDKQLSNKENFNKENLVKKISKELLQYFIEFDEFDRTIIWKELAKTKNLILLLECPDNLTSSYKLIENSILMFIIIDMNPDPRDALLELEEIINTAKKKNIDYKKIINNFIPIANDKDNYGIGSTKEYLLRVC